MAAELETSMRFKNFGARVSFCRANFTFAAICVDHNTHDAGEKQLISCR